MKNVKKLTAIPSGSAVVRDFGEIHFHDTYLIEKRTEMAPEEIYKAIMQLPGWATALFRLRHAIVGIFGLKTGRTDAVFPVISLSDNEIVTGMEDAHLDFRAAVMKDPAAGTISITTIVHFNNFWGRLYFLPVKPFHKAIMKTLLRRFLK